MFDDEVLKTAIITFGSIAVAIIGLLQANRQIAKRKARRENDVSPEEREAVERYSADPGQFVHDIIESNRLLTEEVGGYRKEVRALREELRQFREQDRKFRTALARWILRIIDKFTEHGIPMPLPDDADAELLQDVIPSALEATRPPRPRPA